MYICNGEVAEWSIATVLKTVVQQCTGGSNPSFSASGEKKNPVSKYVYGIFLFIDF